MWQIITPVFVSLWKLFAFGIWYQKKIFDFCGYASTLFCSSQCEYIAFLNVFQLSDIRNTPTVLYFDFKEFLIFVFVILFSHICLFCICALVHDRDYLCLFGLLPFLPRPTGHPVEIYKEISGHNFITWVQVCAFIIREAVIYVLAEFVR